jgi:hypothetical protein
MSNQQDGLACENLEGAIRRSALTLPPQHIGGSHQITQTVRNLTASGGVASGGAHKLTAPEKAFWKDAFLACAHSTLRRHNGKLAPETAVELCANFADASMDVYRSRVIWRKAKSAAEAAAQS